MRWAAASVLGAEVVLLALVHAGVGLLDLLLDLLLELFLLGLGQRRLEAVAVTLAALAGGLLLPLLGPAVLLGILLDIGAGLCHVHLLGALADALALLGGLAVELAEVDLADHLQRGGAFRLLRTLLRLALRRGFGPGGRHLRFGGRLGFGLVLRFRLHRRGFRLRRRLGRGFRHNRLLRLGLRRGFGFRGGLLRFGKRLGFRLRRGLGRFRRGLRSGLLLGVDEGVGLDDGLALRLLFLGFFPGGTPAALLEDLGDLDLHLVGGLLHLEVLAELLHQRGKMLVGDLRIGVGIDFDALLVEEFHQVVEADVELSQEFAYSDICHSV